MHGLRVCMSVMIVCAHTTQPIVREVLFTLSLQSQSHWSLFNGTWQKRSVELDQ